MGEYAKVTVAALAIVPGPNSTITFVEQLRGPFSNHLLLPGGRAEFGEGLAEAARREALEEAGCVLGELSLTGVYEMRGPWAQGDYHVVMFAFQAVQPAVVPEGFHGDVGKIVQVPPNTVRPHPTVMRILNDAGVADYPAADIETALAADRIAMTCHPFSLAGLGSSPSSLVPGQL
jgi:8-oxo-dGTP pyrophosphatase MutT (NUDIX family)